MDNNLLALLIVLGPSVLVVAALWAWFAVKDRKQDAQLKREDEQAQIAWALYLDYLKERCK